MTPFRPSVVQRVGQLSRHDCSCSSDPAKTTALDNSFRQISFERDFVSHVKLFFNYYVHLDIDQEGLEVDSRQLS